MRFRTFFYLTCFSNEIKRISLIKMFKEDFFWYQREVQEYVLKQNENYYRDSVLDVYSLFISIKHFIIHNII